MKMTPEKIKFLEAATAQFGAEGVFKNGDLKAFAADHGFNKSDYNWVFRPEFKQQRAYYKLPPLPGAARKAAPHDKLPATAAAMQPTTQPVEKFNPNAVSEYEHAIVPQRDQHYVPFGDFKDVEKIIKSGNFFPVFISGHSGNGKTFMVEQACSRARRLLVRTQMSRETDEDDLIGGFRLIDGETKFLKGPALRAMELGAVLLVDEADRADPGKIMCLQGILEGKPYFVKKTGEVVYPKPGFNVIVTANTKGKGSDDGRYIAAGILDDAWLERFPITIEQDFPSSSVETRILTSYMQDNEREVTTDDEAFIKNLIAWAQIIRKTFEEGGSDELISTRRLVHIVQTYRMFAENRMRAITLCINRFDMDSKNTFLDLYSKVDATIAPATAPVENKEEIPL